MYKYALVEMPCMCVCASKASFGNEITEMFESKFGHFVEIEVVECLLIALLATLINSFN